MMANLREEMASWGVDFQKGKEKKVYDAVMMLFESAEDIEIFNKKAIYLYIREITNLNTKQVLNSLNKFRFEYSTFKKKWDE